MGKFKVGDEVRTGVFEGAPGFNPKMESFVGKHGKVNSGSLHSDWYEVHGWYWPESALTLMQSTADEFKPGEEVEVRDDFPGIWEPAKFVGFNSQKLFVCENEFGRVDTWDFCRRPQPKMQKWNVVRFGKLLFIRTPEDTVDIATIVHTFELPTQ